MPDRAGKSACDPLKVGEHAVTQLSPHAPDRIREKAVIVHEAADSCGPAAATAIVTPRQLLI
jgi:hypothetical protein